MKKSVKAALLSAFVFPGIGHFFLKKYLSASVFSGLACITVYVLLSGVVTASQIIVDKIQRNEVAFDITTVTDLVHQQLNSTQGQSLNSTFVIFIIVWLISIVDAFRLGYRQDKCD